MVVDDDVHGIYLLARGLGPEPERSRAVRSAAAAAMSLLERSIALDPRAPLDVLARLAIEDANAVVWRACREGAPEVRVVLTLLLVRNGHVAVGHVGHGRVLRVSDGRVEPLTVEHTVLGDHDRFGYPPPRDRAELSAVLTRQLGEHMFVDVDVHGHALPLGTTYLLLSSGFGAVDIAHIEDMASSVEPSRLSITLIERARSAGQHERLSALVIHPTLRESKVECKPQSLGRSSFTRRVWSSLQRGVSRNATRS